MSNNRLTQGLLSLPLGQHNNHSALITKCRGSLLKISNGQKHGTGDLRLINIGCCLHQCNVIIGYWSPTR